MLAFDTPVGHDIAAPDRLRTLLSAFSLSRVKTVCDDCLDLHGNSLV